MQHKIRFIMLVGLVVVSVTTTTAQAINDLSKKEREWKKKAKDTYVFPVLPGTPEWSALGSYQAQLAASQVPDERLTGMSTAGLVETCLNHPFLGDINGGSTYPEGLAELMRQSNGLRALVQRQDAGVTLLTKYAMIDPRAAFQAWQRDHRGNLPHHQLLLIETLLARDDILSGMPLTARCDLLRESLRVFRAKADSQGDYGGQEAVSAMLMARTLESLDDTSLRLRLAVIPTKDAETLRQELLQRRPDLKGQQFKVIPQSAEQRYHNLLTSGGMIGGHEDVFKAIVESVEEYCATMTPEGGRP